MFQPDDYFDILRLDHRLTRWRKELPEHLVIGPDADVSGDSLALSQAISTLCRYLHLKILLFRPAAIEAIRRGLFQRQRPSTDEFALSELQRSLVLGCTQSCISAAQDMINVMHARCTSRANRLPNWWYTTFCESACRK